MTETELRLECAKLANGNVYHAQKIYDFVFNIKPVDENSFSRVVAESEKQSGSISVVLV